MQIGQTFTHERTFTEDEVLSFARFSGDRGTHHLERDARGRLMVHGLLTAMLPTKIGGDLNYIARDMHFEFVRPVFTGDAIRCDLVVTSLTRRENRIEVEVEGSCRNQHGKDVLLVKTRGVVLAPRDGWDVSADAADGPETPPVPPGSAPDAE
jgi:acyl dehydratase